MNQGYFSDTDCGTHIRQLEPPISYWLDRERSPEEADEMERLKEKQRKIEKERREQKAEQTGNPRLSDEQRKAWPS